MTIKPNEGVANILFGMSRDVIRESIGMQPRAKRTDSPVPADLFPNLGLIIHYDADGVVEAIEMAEPAVPLFFSKSLIGQPFDEIVNWFRSIDPRTIIDESGLTSFRFGIGLYAPHAATSPRDPIEGVIVFRPGYYG